MIYALTNKKISQIIYYISLFFFYEKISSILEYDNRKKFTKILLLFCKKYNIKLINNIIPST